MFRASVVLVLVVAAVVVTINNRHDEQPEPQRIPTTQVVGPGGRLVTCANGWSVELIDGKPWRC